MAFWGELPRDFARQIANAESIDLNHGTMTKTRKRVAGSIRRLVRPFDQAETSIRPLLSERLFGTVLFRTVIGSIQRHRAADQEIPVRPMLNDEMKVRNLFEVVLDALRPIIAAVLDNGLPALFAMKIDHVVHLRSVAAAIFDQGEKPVAEINTVEPWDQS